MNPPTSATDSSRVNNANEFGTKTADGLHPQPHKADKNAKHLKNIQPTHEIPQNCNAQTLPMESDGQYERPTSEDDHEQQFNGDHHDDDSQQTIQSPHANETSATFNDLNESFQSSSRQSSTLLSRLQSSASSSSSIDTTSHRVTTSTNLPTSLANAFSSLTSSFSSSFNLGNPSNSSTVNSSTTSNSNNNNSNVNNINNQRRGSNKSVASSLTIETVSTSIGVTSFNRESRKEILSKKATCERKNLINLTKLIVKDLISSSLSVGRTIDENHSAIHLNNYFTLIDRVLKHGLKQNIMSSRSASLWNALDNLPKYLTDKRLTSETVRSLAHTKTPDGRIRAWLRIAMMQKKLPDYFNELLANKNVLLKDIYHESAFMMNDDAQMFAGLIIGVNVIDCNFFVKDDNFDSMDEVIDLSPYLKAANSFEEGDEQDVLASADTSNQIENMTAVLDQKNYLEERSKHLESTIDSLQVRIKQLEELNSHLEIDAKVNEVRIQKLQSGETISEKSPMGANFAIPDALKGLISSSNGSRRAEQTNIGTKKTETSQPRVVTQMNVQSNTSLVCTKSPQESEESCSQSGLDHDKSMECLNEDHKVKGSNDDAQAHLLTDEIERYKKLSSNLEKELSYLRERVTILETSYRGALEKIRVLERDLDIQTSMNKDKETTIKIYEKDLREKQCQVESFRESLSEAKKLNVDLNEKLNDTGAKLKERLSSVTNLQTSLDKWKIENKTLASRLQDKQVALKSVNAELEKALKSVQDLKLYNEKINNDLRKERECGQSSSSTVETQTAKINELTDRLKTLEKELVELRSMRDKAEELERRCQEYELSLEEVGYQLRESRLEVESLKENSSMFLDSQWMDSKQVKNCALCRQAFSVTRRKHHCRLCGNVFCQTCSDNKMELASSSKPARVCDTCHAFLLAKFVKSSSSTSSIATTNSNSTTKS